LKWEKTGSAEKVHDPDFVKTFRSKHGRSPNKVSSFELKPTEAPKHQRTPFLSSPKREDVAGAQAILALKNIFALD
jgi:hypothetical protein